MSRIENQFTLAQKTFGSNHDFPNKKYKAIITNPQGVVMLTPFDDLPNRLEVVIASFPEFLSRRNTTALKMIRLMYAEHGECPADKNFWEWWISIRAGRVSTLDYDFTTMFRYLQIAGYYSKSFKSIYYNFRLNLRDGVQKADLILTEDEIAYLVRMQYDLSLADNVQKQRALDTFILGIFTGARYADIQHIVKSTDAEGNPVLLFHNRKGTRQQSIAWNPAVQGALKRKLYKNQRIAGTITSSALKRALREALPTTSNRLISYYFIRPGKGRELRTDPRLENVTYHCARHTFCTRLLRAGVSPSIVAQLMGHKNILTTMKYYNWTKDVEANDILREVYAAKGVASEAPVWGKGAQTKRLPAYVVEKMLMQPQPPTKYAKGAVFEKEVNTKSKTEIRKQKELRNRALRKMFAES